MGNQPSDEATYKREEMEMDEYSDVHHGPSPSGGGCYLRESDAIGMASRQVSATLECRPGRGGFGALPQPVRRIARGLRSREGGDGGRGNGADGEGSDWSGNEDANQEVEEDAGNGARPALAWASVKASTRRPHEGNADSHGDGVRLGQRGRHVVETDCYRNRERGSTTGVGDDAGQWLSEASWRHKDFGSPGDLVLLQPVRRPRGIGGEEQGPVGVVEGFAGVGAGGAAYCSQGDVLGDIKRGAFDDGFAVLRSEKGGVARGHACEGWLKADDRSVGGSVSRVEPPSRSLHAESGFTTDQIESPPSAPAAPSSDPEATSLETAPDETSDRSGSDRRDPLLTDASSHLDGEMFPEDPEDAPGHGPDDVEAEPNSLSQDGQVRGWMALDVGLSGSGGDGDRVVGFRSSFGGQDGERGTGQMQGWEQQSERGDGSLQREQRQRRRRLLRQQQQLQQQQRRQPRRQPRHVGGESSEEDNETGKIAFSPEQEGGATGAGERGGSASGRVGKHGGSAPDEDGKYSGDRLPQQQVGMKSTVSETGLGLGAEPESGEDFLMDEEEGLVDPADDDTDQSAWEEGGSCSTENGLTCSPGAAHAFTLSDGIGEEASASDEKSTRPWEDWVPASSAAAVAVMAVTAETWERSAAKAPLTPERQPLTEKNPGLEEEGVAKHVAEEPKEENDVRTKAEELPTRVRRGRRNSIVEDCAADAFAEENLARRCPISGPDEDEANDRCERATGEDIGGGDSSGGTGDGGSAGGGGRVTSEGSPGGDTRPLLTAETQKPCNESITNYPQPAYGEIYDEVAVAVAAEALGAEGGGGGIASQRCAHDDGSFGRTNLQEKVPPPADGDARAPRSESNAQEEMRTGVGSQNDEKQRLRKGSRSSCHQRSAAALDDDDGAVEPCRPSTDDGEHAKACDDHDDPDGVDCEGNAVENAAVVDTANIEAASDGCVLGVNGRRLAESALVVRGNAQAATHMEAPVDEAAEGSVSCAMEVVGEGALGSGSYDEDCIDDDRRPPDSPLAARGDEQDQKDGEAPFKNAAIAATAADADFSSRAEPDSNDCALKVDGDRLGSASKDEDPDERLSAPSRFTRRKSRSGGYYKAPAEVAAADASSVLFEDPVTRIDGERAPNVCRYDEDGGGGQCVSEPPLVTGEKSLGVENVEAPVEDAAASDGWAPEVYGEASEGTGRDDLSDVDDGHSLYKSLTFAPGDGRGVGDSGRVVANAPTAHAAGASDDRVTKIDSEGERGFDTGDENVDGNGNGRRVEDSPRVTRRNGRDGEDLEAPAKAAASDAFAVSNCSVATVDGGEPRVAGSGNDDDNATCISEALLVTRGNELDVGDGKTPVEEAVVAYVAADADAVHDDSAKEGDGDEARIVHSKVVGADDGRRLSNSPLVTLQGGYIARDKEAFLMDAVAAVAEAPHNCVTEVSDGGLRGADGNDYSCGGDVEHISESPLTRGNNQVAGDNNAPVEDPATDVDRDSDDNIMATDGKWSRGGGFSKDGMNDDDGRRVSDPSFVARSHMRGVRDYEASVGDPTVANADATLSERDMGNEGNGARDASCDDDNGGENGRRVPEPSLARRDGRGIKDTEAMVDDAVADITTADCDRDSNDCMREIDGEQSRGGGSDGEGGGDYDRRRVCDPRLAGRVQRRGVRDYKAPLKEAADANADSTCGERDIEAGGEGARGAVNNKDGDNDGRPALNSSLSCVIERSMGHGEAPVEEAAIETTTDAAAYVEGDSLDCVKDFDGERSRDAGSDEEKCYGNGRHASDRPLVARGHGQGIRGSIKDDDAAVSNDDKAPDDCNMVFDREGARGTSRYNENGDGNALVEDAAVDVASHADVASNECVMGVNSEVLWSGGYEDGGDDNDGRRASGAPLTARGGHGPGVRDYEAPIEDASTSVNADAASDDCDMEVDSEGAPPGADSDDEDGSDNVQGFAGSSPGHKDDDNDGDDDGRLVSEHLPAVRGNVRVVDGQTPRPSTSTVGEPRACDGDASDLPPPLGPGGVESKEDGEGDVSRRNGVGRDQDGSGDGEGVPETDPPPCDTTPSAGSSTTCSRSAPSAAEASFTLPTLPFVWTALSRANESERRSGDGDGGARTRAAARRRAAAGETKAIAARGAAAPTAAASSSIMMLPPPPPRQPPLPPRQPPPPPRQPAPPEEGSPQAEVSRTDEDHTVLLRDGFTRWDPFSGDRWHRVAVWDRRKKCMLGGTAAPMRHHLKKLLEGGPYEIYTGQDGNHDGPVTFTRSGGVSSDPRGRGRGRPPSTSVSAAAATQKDSRCSLAPADGMPRDEPDRRILRQGASLRESNRARKSKSGGLGRGVSGSTSDCSNAGEAEVARGEVVRGGAENRGRSDGDGSGVLQGKGGDGKGGDDGVPATAWLRRGGKVGKGKVGKGKGKGRGKRRTKARRGAGDEEAKAGGRGDGSGGGSDVLTNHRTPKKRPRKRVGTHGDQWEAMWARGFSDEEEAIATDERAYERTVRDRRRFAQQEKSEQEAFLRERERLKAMHKMFGKKYRTPVERLEDREMERFLDASLAIFDNDDALEEHDSSASLHSNSLGARNARSDPRSPVAKRKSVRRGSAAPSPTTASSEAVTAEVARTKTVRGAAAIDGGQAAAGAKVPSEEGEGGGSSRHGEERQCGGVSTRGGGRRCPETVAVTTVSSSLAEAAETAMVAEREKGAGKKKRAALANGVRVETDAEVERGVRGGMHEQGTREESEGGSANDRGRSKGEGSAIVDEGSANAETASRADTQVGSSRSDTDLQDGYHIRLTCPICSASSELKPVTMTGGQGRGSIFSAAREKASSQPPQEQLGDSCEGVAAGAPPSCLRRNPAVSEAETATAAAAATVAAPTANEIAEGARRAGGAQRKPSTGVCASEASARARKDPVGGLGDDGGGRGGEGGTEAASGGRQRGAAATAGASESSTKISIATNRDDRKGTPIGAETRLEGGEGDRGVGTTEPEGALCPSKGGPVGVTKGVDTDGNGGHRVDEDSFWCPPFRIIEGLPPYNRQFNREFQRAYRRGLILKTPGAVPKPNVVPDTLVPAATRGWNNHGVERLQQQPRKSRRHWSKGKNDKRRSSLGAEKEITVVEPKASPKSRRDAPPRPADVEAEAEALLRQGERSAVVASRTRSSSCDTSRPSEAGGAKSDPGYCGGGLRDGSKAWEGGPDDPGRTENKGSAAIVPAGRTSNMRDSGIEALPEPTVTEASRTALEEGSATRVVSAATAATEVELIQQATAVASTDPATEVTETASASAKVPVPQKTGVCEAEVEVETEVEAAEGDRRASETPTRTEADVCAERKYLKFTGFVETVASSTMSLRSRQKQQLQQQHQPLMMATRYSAQSSARSSSPKPAEVDSRVREILPRNSAPRCKDSSSSSSSSADSAATASDGDNRDAATINRGSSATLSSSTAAPTGSIIAALLQAADEAGSVATAAASSAVGSEPIPPAAFFEEVVAERRRSAFAALGAPPALPPPTGSEAPVVPAMRHRPWPSSVDQGSVVCASPTECGTPALEPAALGTVEPVALVIPDIRVTTAVAPRRSWPASRCTVVDRSSPLLWTTSSSSPQAERSVRDCSPPLPLPVEDTKPEADAAANECRGEVVEATEMTSGGEHTASGKAETGGSDNEDVTVEVAPAAPSKARSVGNQGEHNGDAQFSGSGSRILGHVPYFAASVPEDAKAVEATAVGTAMATTVTASSKMHSLGDQVDDRDDETGSSGSLVPFLHIAAGLGDAGAVEATVAGTAVATAVTVSSNTHSLRDQVCGHNDETGSSSSSLVPSLHTATGLGDAGAVEATVAETAVVTKVTASSKTHSLGDQVDGRDDETGSNSSFVPSLHTAAGLGDAGAVEATVAETAVATTMTASSKTHSLGDQVDGRDDTGSSSSLVPSLHTAAGLGDAGAVEAAVARTVIVFSKAGSLGDQGDRRNEETGSSSSLVPSLHTAADLGDTGAAETAVASSTVASASSAPSLGDQVDGRDAGNSSSIPGRSVHPSAGRANTGTFEAPVADASVVIASLVSSRASLLGDFLDDEDGLPGSGTSGTLWDVVSASASPKTAAAVAVASTSSEAHSSGDPADGGDGDTASSRNRSEVVAAASGPEPAGVWEATMASRRACRVKGPAGGDDGAGSGNKSLGQVVPAVAAASPEAAEAPGQPPAVAESSAATQSPATRRRQKSPKSATARRSVRRGSSDGRRVPDCVPFPVVTSITKPLQEERGGGALKPPRGSSSNSGSDSRTGISRGRGNADSRWCGTVAPKPTHSVFDMPSEEEGSDGGDVVTGTQIKRPEAPSPKRKGRESDDVGGKRNVRTRTSHDDDRGLDATGVVTYLRTDDQCSSTPQTPPSKNKKGLDRFRDGSKTVGETKKPTRRCLQRSTVAPVPIPPQSTPPLREKVSGKSRKKTPIASRSNSAKVRKLPSPHIKGANKRDDPSVASTQAIASSMAGDLPARPSPVAAPNAASEVLKGMGTIAADESEETFAPLAVPVLPAAMMTVADLSRWRRQSFSEEPSRDGDAVSAVVPTDVRPDTVPGRPHNGDTAPIHADSLDARPETQGSGDPDEPTVVPGNEQHRAYPKGNVGGRGCCSGGGIGGDGDGGGRNGVGDGGNDESPSLNGALQAVAFGDEQPRPAILKRSSGKEALGEGPTEAPAAAAKWPNGRPSRKTTPRVFYGDEDSDEDGLRSGNASGCNRPSVSRRNRSPKASAALNPPPRMVAPPPSRAFVVEAAQLDLDTAVTLCSIGVGGRDCRPYSSSTRDSYSGNEIDSVKRAVKPGRGDEPPPPGSLPTDAERTAVSGGSGSAGKRITKRGNMRARRVDDSAAPAFTAFYSGVDADGNVVSAQGIEWDGGRGRRGGGYENVRCGEEEEGKHGTGAGRAKGKSTPKRYHFGLVAPGGGGDAGGENAPRAVRRKKPTPKMYLQQQQQSQQQQQQSQQQRQQQQHQELHELQQQQQQKLHEFQQQQKVHELQQQQQVQQQWLQEQYQKNQRHQLLQQQQQHQQQQQQQQWWEKMPVRRLNVRSQPQPGGSSSSPASAKRTGGAPNGINPADSGRSASESRTEAAMAIHGGDASSSPSVSPLAPPNPLLSPPPFERFRAPPRSGGILGGEHVGDHDGRNVSRSSHLGAYKRRRQDLLFPPGCGNRPWNDEIEPGVETERQYFPSQRGRGRVPGLARGWRLNPSQDDEEEGIGAFGDDMFLRGAGHRWMSAGGDMVEGRGAVAPGGSEGVDGGSVSGSIESGAIFRSVGFPLGEHITRPTAPVLGLSTVDFRAGGGGFHRPGDDFVFRPNIDNHRQQQQQQCKRLQQRLQQRQQQRQQPCLLQPPSALQSQPIRVSELYGNSIFDDPLPSSSSSFFSDASPATAAPATAAPATAALAAAAPATPDPASPAPAAAGRFAHVFDRNDFGSFNSRDPERAMHRGVPPIYSNTAAGNDAAGQWPLSSSSGLPWVGRRGKVSRESTLFSPSREESCIEMVAGAVRAENMRCRRHDFAEFSSDGGSGVGVEGSLLGVNVSGEETQQPFPISFSPWPMS